MGGGGPYVIDPQIYSTVWVHSGIYPRCNSGFFNWVPIFKDIGAEASRNISSALLLYALYPLKYIDYVLNPKKNDHLSTPLTIS